jgi:NAD(P) transhydrogenase
LLRKKGFSQVLVERNSGVEAQFLDEQYAAAGATLVSQDELYKASDIVLKVRPPLQGQETELLKEGSTVISFLYPAQNKAIVDTLATRKVNAFAVSVPNTIWSHALK